MPSHPTNPWHMLAPLDGERAEERDLLELTRFEELHVINNVAAAARSSLIYAMSGNGKTSLLNAGVIPFFRGHGHAVFTTRPRPAFARHDPRQAFRQSILDQLPDAVRAAHDADALQSLEDFIQTAQRTELKSFADRFRLFAQTTPADPAIARAVQERMTALSAAPLPEFMRGVADLIGRNRPILVICDQFEELFVHFANEPVLQQFIEDLGAIWADGSLNVRLLFSMREDWVGSMIAFRRVIPDIFKDTFRLQPLTTTHARQVLTVPLESRGFRFSEDAVEHILRDLATAYDRVEKRRLGRIEPDDAEPEVRFVELPAVHLVASKLWETRNHPKPFSLEHYLSLPAAETEGGRLSPAATVVANFLNDALSRKESERVLQVDTLYLLTDGERHRRASSADAIVRELRRVRPSQLFVSQPPAAEINDVVAPLVAKGLVRCIEGTQGLEYELGHDYAVRAVVRKWRELDLARAKELGKLARDQEQKELRLQDLEAKNDRARHILQIAPAVGLIGWVWAAFSLAADNVNALTLDMRRSGSGFVIFTAYIVMLVAGAISRHRLSIIIAGLALTTATIVSSLVGHNRVPEEAPMTFGWAVPVLLILSLRSVADLQSSRRWQRFFSVVWAELIDLLLSIIVVGGIMVGAAEIMKGEILVFMFLTTVIAVFAVRVWYLHKTQSTVGLALIGLAVAGAQKPITLRRAIFREFLFTVWAALNGFMLLAWLVLSPLASWFTGRSLPDFLARLEIVPSADVRPRTHASEERVVRPLGNARGQSAGSTN